MTQAQRPPANSAPARPVNRGPVSLFLAAVLGFVFAVLMSWFLGIVVEILGLYIFWPEQGVKHS